MMEIGFCTGPDRVREIAAAGFDYAELPVSRIAEMPEEKFESLLREIRTESIPVPTFNVLFPGTLPLMAKETGEKEIRAYLEPALERVERLGGKTVVFGSGRSRNRPEGMTYAEAFRRLTQVTRIIGETAGKFGVTIALEPLNRRECNMINSVAEGACLTAAVNHPSVRLLGDYYHIAAEGEPPEDILRVGGIVHAHIASAENRTIPLEKEEGLRRMFAAMKRSGYQGRISVEGRCDDLASEGPQSVRMLKELWAEA